MDFYEILGQIMEEKGLGIADVARICGLTDSTVRSIFDRRQRKIALNVAFKLSDGLGVSLERLNGLSERAGTKKAPSDISEEAKKLAVDYDHHLDTWGQKAVRGLADTEMARVASAEPEESSTPPKDKKPAARVTALPKAKRRRDGFTEIEVYDQPAAAGLGNYLDTPPSHMEQYPAELVPDRTDFGVLISGDSMEPNIPNGSTVFVQSAPTVDAGEIGIFVLDGKSYCKMLSVDHDRGQVRLISVNSAYADIPIGEADELRTLGRVLGHYAPRRWN